LNRCAGRSKSVKPGRVLGIVVPTGRRQGSLLATCVQKKILSSFGDRSIIDASGTLRTTSGRGKSVGRAWVFAHCRSRPREPIERQCATNHVQVVGRVMPNGLQNDGVRDPFPTPSSGSGISTVDHSLENDEPLVSKRSSGCICTAVVDRLPADILSSYRVT
jgi:hypothetical protein